MIFKDSTMIFKFLLYVALASLASSELLSGAESAEFKHAASELESLRENALLHFEAAAQHLEEALHKELDTLRNKQLPSSLPKLHGFIERAKAFLDPRVGSFLHPKVSTFLRQGRETSSGLPNLKEIVGPKQIPSFPLPIYYAAIALLVSIPAIWLAMKGFAYWNYRKYTQQARF
jgi:hypothetical protein